MNLIVCIDDRNGILFNQRRVSRDRNIVEDVKSIVQDKTLYVSEYSSKLFEDFDVEIISSIEEAKDGFVFIEDFTDYDKQDVEEVVVYCFNRKYPADVYFEFDLSTMSLESEYEFEGYSHEKITRKVYKKVTEDEK